MFPNFLLIWSVTWHARGLSLQPISEAGLPAMVRAGLRVRLWALDSPPPPPGNSICSDQASFFHRQQITKCKDLQAIESKPREEFENRLKGTCGQLLLRNCALNRFQSGAQCWRHRPVKGSRSSWHPRNSTKTPKGHVSEKGSSRPALRKFKNKPWKDQTDLWVKCLLKYKTQNSVQGDKHISYSTTYPQCSLHSQKLLNVAKGRKMWPITRNYIFKHTTANETNWDNRDVRISLQ